MTEETLGKKLESMTSIYKNTHLELIEAQEELCKTKKLLQDSKPKNLKRKIQRRDITIGSLAIDKQELEDSLNAALHKIERLEVDVVEMKSERRKLMTSANYLKRKVEKIEDQPQQNDASMIDEVKELERKIAVLTEENKTLNELRMLLNSQQIVTFQNGQFIAILFVFV